MDPELKKALDAIAQMNSDFAEMKKTNDLRIVALEEGKGVAELDQKIAKINEAIEKNGDVKERFEKIETALKRKGPGTGDNKDGLTEEQMEHHNAICNYMRTDKTVDGAEAKFLAVQSNPDGGYWVSPDMTGRVTKQVFESSPLRSLASVQTIGTDSLQGIIDDDEPDADWVGETELVAQGKTPKIGLWEIPAMELSARPLATNKLLEDANINPEEWLAGKVGRKFARKEATAFVLGDGDKKPRGFTNYDDAADANVYEQGKIGTIETKAAALGFDDVYELLYLLKDEWAANATFGANREIHKQLRLLKDQENRYLWEPSNQVGQPPLLAGTPIMQFNDMARSNAGSGAIILAIADWTDAYQIVDRTGISVLRDPFTKKPFVEFYTRMRVGGAVIGFDSIKRLKIK